ncbi:peptide/nickel transport system substrate-binding protein [Fictibacillus solisalsi]|uniref:Peptide/nickel transport system substrate-binding protein n=1 Tax=Fictibacillus solisalsi TaxID=459525 RepID=A0A1G9V2G6_9BACL|nr:ABC transporter substrate-binding protein [Fictibacillus solisalsi]SDM66471.1 peptide/nickel transport system substrate-binding protein [Fictibacillus solisalsi]
MRSPYKLFFVAYLMVMLLVSGCSNQSSTRENEKGTKGETGKDKTTLVLAQSADITTMDPQNSLSTTGDRVFRNMFNRLFYRDANMEVQPELVEAYENVDDVTWKFKLKQGVTFHNGDPLTAEDVKFSLERVMNDQTLKEYPYFTQLAKIKVIDDLTLEIITDGPMPTLLRLLAKSGADVIPKKYFEEVGLKEFQKKPIGSGPYQFVEWKRDDRVVLEAYPDYFDGAPKWKEVIVRAIPESSTRVGELLTGGVDIATDIPPNEWDRVNGDEGVSLVTGDTTRIMLLVVRTTEGSVTADPKVREAIDLAINEKAIVDSVLKGTGVPVRSRVPEGVIGSNPDLYDAYVYDVEKAKKLLAEAGFKDGLEITLTAPKGRYPLDGEVAQLIASMLGEAGIKVNLKLLESSAFLDIYNSNSNEELLMIGLADGLLDASYSLVHYTKERATGQTDYYNEKVEKLYHDAGRNLNEEERIKQYQEIQAIIAEERPHITLFQQGSNYGVSDRVEFKPRLDEVINFSDISVK